MTGLFINACVRSGSRTLRLCQAYLRSHWLAQGIQPQEVELQALGLKPLDRQLLEQRDRDIACGSALPQRYALARSFAAADALLIGAPYWDLSFPALLKVYLEQICVNGITFGYGAGGTPLGLCRAKSLVYITTAGGLIPQNSSLEQYLRELCDMFGIPELRFWKAEGLDLDGSDVEAILAQAEAQMAAR